ncbi:chitosanase [Actinomycetospora succinea]|uniref:Chitosanase n=1 Tax=Actinomycetospora succinea TaxID=663603 RepID=A0A4R6UNU7_9PSEU|nr:chitosanase [Actinomycetospora succinea]TDQ48838.1 chitosanase [Actinomycetospora succinea]
MNRRSFLALGAAVAGWTALGACSAPSIAADPRAPGLLDPTRKHTAEAVISTFENSTTELPYAAAQRLGDGRGITAGRAGFTSGTHDLLLVVRRYEQIAGPQNPLHRYLQPLTRIDSQVADGGDGDSTKGLDGFEDAWRRASQTDPRLNQAQDAVYDDLYFRPAMDRARAIGITNALGQLALLDTGIQHGIGSGPDDLPALITETGPPAGDDPAWLRRFLEVRREHLEHPAYEETTDVWRESLPRVDTLESFIDQRQFDLATPLSWTFAGSRFNVG